MYELHQMNKQINIKNKSNNTRQAQQPTGGASAMKLGHPRDVRRHQPADKHIHPNTTLK